MALCKVEERVVEGQRSHSKHELRNGPLLRKCVQIGDCLDSPGKKSNLSCISCPVIRVVSLVARTHGRTDGGRDRQHHGHNAMKIARWPSASGAKKLSKQELRFMCTAIPLDEIYPPTKFNNHSKYSLEICTGQNASMKINKGQ